MHDKILKYKPLLLKLGFGESFYSGFVDAVELDIQYANHKNARTKSHHTSYFLFNVFLIFIYMLLSNFACFFLTLFFYRFDKQRLGKSDNIFIPFPDVRYIRFRLIPEIFPDNHLILYPPTFNFKATFKHSTYFHQKKSIFLLTSFGFFTPINFVLISFKLRKEFKNIRSILSPEDINFFKNSLQIPILVSVAYKIYFENVINSLSLNDKKRNWFFDFDKDYKYLAFNEVIKKSRNEDKTVHIQHGLFWNEDLVYIKPSTDYIFCCSKREKQIIDQSILNPNRSFVIGAPLQTFVCENNSEIEFLKVEKTKVLIILTVCVHDEVLELQKQVINYLQNKGESLQIRFRPASLIEDEKIIRPILNDKSEISRYNSLIQDISEAKMVISFSEDSLLNCFKLNKTIYFGCPYDPKFLRENLDKSMPFYFFQTKNEFLKMYNQNNYIEHYNWSDNSFVEDNFGSNSINILFNRFRSAVEKLNNPNTF